MTLEVDSTLKWLRSWTISTRDFIMRWRITQFPAAVIGIGLSRQLAVVKKLVLAIENGVTIKDSFLKWKHICAKNETGPILNGRNWRSSNSCEVLRPRWYRHSRKTWKLSVAFYRPVNVFVFLFLGVFFLLITVVDYGTSPSIQTREK